MRLRFQLDQDTNRLAIKSYGPGWIKINEEEIHHSVIVMPEKWTDWTPQTFSALTEADFAAIAQQDVEIVLLGTGDHQQFPHPRLTQALIARGIGLEVMDTAAACRTYNLLMLEGRQVAAALLLAND